MGQHAVDIVCKGGVVGILGRGYSLADESHVDPVAEAVVGRQMEQGTRGVQANPSS